MLRSLFALCVVAGVSSVPAVAQHQLVLDKLNELNAKAPQPPLADLERTVAATAKAYGEANKVCVPASIKLGDVAPITGAKGILQGVMTGQLRNAWTVYANHAGCTGFDSIRYIVLQKPDGSLQSAIVNEGRTFANPSIMRDTSMLAAMAALQKGRSLDSTCTGETMKMGQTRVTAQSKDLGPEIYGARYAGSWSEVWQFKTCGRTFDVPIDFTPDGDGGAYTNVKSDAVAVAP